MQQTVNEQVHLICYPKRENCRKPQINQYTEEIYNEVDAQLYDTKINQA